MSGVGEGLTAGESQVLSMTPRPRKQHLVSETLLRGWTVGGELSVVQLLHHGGPRVRPVGPGGVARERDLTSRFTVDEIEDAWSAIESRAGEALPRVRAGGGPDDDHTVQAIKDLVCLHLTRSYETLTMWDRIRQENEDMREVVAMIEDDDLMRQHIFEQTGLYVVGSEGLESHRDELLAWVDTRQQGWFSRNLNTSYDRVKDYIASAGLEIWHTESEDELVIGDCPAFTVSRDGSRFGLDEGVSIDGAGSIVMPLGPCTLAAIGPEDRSSSLSSMAARDINIIQCRRAHKQVVCRPSSGLDEWVVQRYWEENIE